jgi:antitoxin HicB
MFYPITLKADGNGWMVTFPDLPEAITGADTREQALAMARDALVTALDFYFEDKREVPMPSKVKRGQETVSLPASQWAKVLLLNEMVRQKKRPIDIARLMGTSPQVFNRITDLHHATKVDQIEEALGVLGRRLELRLAA